MKRFLAKLRGFLFPRAENAYKPGLYKNEAVAILAVILVVVEVAYLAQVFFISPRSAFLAAILPSVLVEQTNEARSDSRVPALSRSALLERAAQKKADDMAANGYFSHTGPDGALPWKWLDLVGYAYSHAGENLAVNFTDSGEVTTAWLQSPTHKANLLKKEFEEIGIGVATGTYQGREALFVAQFLATPARPPSAKEVIVSRIEEPAGASPNVLAAEAAPPPAPAQNEIVKLAEKAATSPSRAASTAFYAFIAFIAAVFLFTVFIKIRIQHSEVFVASFALIGLAFFFVFLNSKIVPHVVLPSDTSAAAFEALR